MLTPIRKSQPFVLLALFLCFSVPGFAQLGSWGNAQALPSNLYEAATALMPITDAQADIYLFGGATGSGYNMQSYRADFESLAHSGCSGATSTTGCWSAIAPMPHPRQNHEALAAPNGKIYVLGGQYGSNWPGMDIYDIASDSWQSAGMPIQVADFAAAIIETKIYIAGGRSPNGISNLAFVYDINTGIWSPLPNLPTARYGVSGCSGLLNNPSRGLFWTVGGYDGSNILGTSEVFDPLTNTWSAQPTLPARAFGDVAPQFVSFALANGDYWRGNEFYIYSGGFDGAGQLTDIDILFFRGHTPGPTSMWQNPAPRAHHEIEFYQFFDAMCWFGFQVRMGGFGGSSLLGTSEGVMIWTALPDDRLRLHVQLEDEALALYGEMDAPEEFTACWFEKNSGDGFVPCSEEQNAMAQPSGLDRNPGKGTLFYRLAGRTQNGETVYSEAVSARLSTEFEVSLFPNPSKGPVLLQANGLETEEELKWQVRDVQGKMVGGGMATWNGMDLKLDLESLAPGSYLLEVRTTAGTRLLKMIRD